MTDTPKATKIDVDDITLRLGRLSSLGYFIEHVAEAHAAGLSTDDLWAGISAIAHQIGEQCETLEHEVSELYRTLTDEKGRA